MNATEFRNWFLYQPQEPAGTAVFWSLSLRSDIVQEGNATNRA
jgi:hypothetical protein